MLFLGYFETPGWASSSARGLDCMAISFCITFSTPIVVRLSHFMRESMASE